MINEKLRHGQYPIFPAHKTMGNWIFQLLVLASFIGFVPGLTAYRTDIAGQAPLHLTQVTDPRAYGLVECDPAGRLTRKPPYIFVGTECI